MRIGKGSTSPVTSGPTPEVKELVRVLKEVSEDGIFRVGLGGMCERGRVEEATKKAIASSDRPQDVFNMMKTVIDPLLPRWALGGGADDRDTVKNRTDMYKRLQAAASSQQALLNMESAISGVLAQPDPGQVDAFQAASAPKQNRGLPL